MRQLPQAIAAVMIGTVVSGIMGGIVGAAIGWLAPSFVSWLHTPTAPGGPNWLNPVEFGLGLGAVSGLFLGTGACLFLALVLALRDAQASRAGAGFPDKAGTWNREV